jgi:hypothetical protein
MQTPDEHRPGVREAHLLRKKDNPLFPAAAREVSNEALATARLQDRLDMDGFMEEFQSLVQRAVALQPNAPSEDVLAIKEQLDQGYQKVCALPGDQSQLKAAIRRLLEVIMRAVRSGIGNDAYAARQLEEEAQAREDHFALQELPLVAALTHAESPVAEDELIPSLLSEDDDSLQRCLLLFDDNQLAAICHAAGLWLEEMDPERKIPAAWRRLALIEARYRKFGPPADAN